MVLRVLAIRPVQPVRAFSGRTHHKHPDVRRCQVGRAPFRTSSPGMPRAARAPPRPSMSSTVT